MSTLDRTNGNSTSGDVISGHGAEIHHHHTAVVIAPRKHAMPQVHARHNNNAPQRHFQERALFFLTMEHPLRKVCIMLCTSKYFDTFIMFMILVNSTFYGITDYSVVNDQLGPVSNGKTFDAETGKLVPAVSHRNLLLEQTELPFTLLFTFEAFVKIVSLGFVSGRHAYLQDSWNLLDFTVVVASLVAILPGIPNVSAIRTIRILRPLRSLSVIPGMRRLITALLQALPGLGNVLMVQLLVFSIFGILGIQLFQGTLWTRCRLTPFPVKLELNTTTNQGLWPPSSEYLRRVLNFPDDYICLPLNTSLVDTESSFTKETSPWFHAQDCFWPFDPSDSNVCSLASALGRHHCKPGTFCGSDYDAFGNKRFRNQKASEIAFYDDNLDYGFTNFDNILISWLPIFQTITAEGWSQIMYMCMDSSSPVIAGLYFTALIIFASMFLMNLTLAVIADEFHMDEKRPMLSTSTTLGANKLLESTKSVVDVGHNGSDKMKRPWLQSVLFPIVSSTLFTTSIMLAIVANTVVLSLDHYPMPSDLDANLEIANFLLSCVFLVEMVLKLIGLGPKLYCRDRFNLFDAFVVSMSVLETVLFPPSFMSSNPTKKRAISVLRSFRLFRVFKLARSWRGLRDLLATIGRTLAGIANFGVLLFIFIYSYALLGRQFFANQLRFDEDGFVLRPNDPGFWEAEVPRSNFDSLLWAIVTVFQVISGENWNVVLYDGIRANGFVVALYFIILIVFGRFILMNLFLALLLDNFATEDKDVLLQKQKEIREIAKRIASLKMLTVMGRRRVGRQDSLDRRYGQVMMHATSIQLLYQPRTIRRGMTRPSINASCGPKLAQVSSQLLASALATNRSRAASTAGMDAQPRRSVVRTLVEAFDTSTAADLGALEHELEQPLDLTGSFINSFRSTTKQKPSSGDVVQSQSPKHLGSHGWINGFDLPSDAQLINNKPDVASTDADTLTQSLSPSIKDLDSYSLRVKPLLESPQDAEGSDEVQYDEVVDDDDDDDDEEDEEEEKDQEQDSEEAALAKAFLPPAGKSFFLFAPRNKYRKFVYRLISHSRFEACVLTLIVTSSIALAVDNPLNNPRSDLSRVLRQMDLVYAVLFTFEMVLKLFALGVIGHKGSYLRNNWNILDAIIVVSSIVMLVLDNSSSGQTNNKLKSLRSLRGLRTFRPLRMVSRRPGLKLVVNALFESIPSVMNVVLVCTLFFLIFSIFAVNYLKGRLNGCGGQVFDALSQDQVQFLTFPITSWNATTPQQKEWFANTTCDQFASTSHVTSRYICECWNGSWLPTSDMNFDNVPRAMLTFYELSTTEGWVDLMNTVVDSTSIDMQPYRNASELWALFFVFFIVVGSFFVVNLLVGVIIDNFNRMKAALGGDFMLTPEQKKWIVAKRAASRIGPIRVIRPPTAKWRRVTYDLVKTSFFEWFVMISIIINTLLMAVQYFGQPTLQKHIIGVLNDVFACVFTIEAVLKIISYGFAYFKDFWDKFDFGIVVGTLISILIEELTTTSFRSLTMLARVFRVSRILRLVKTSKSIRQIFLTVYITLPQLSNISSILFLILFIYATMGVQMFAKIAFHKCIDEHANFQGFWLAMLYLLRVATGENWDQCMYDFASNVDKCVDDPEYDDTMCGFNDFEGCKALNGCGSSFSFLYFCTFTFLVTFVMLNLTIAVILEGFSSSQEDEEPLFEPELLDEFRKKWAKLDPEALGELHVSFLDTLVRSIETPLGKSGTSISKVELMKYIGRLDLQLYENEVIVFRDVLIAMTREMVRENANEFVEPPGVTDEELAITSHKRIEFLADEYFAARFVQISFIRWVRRKREVEQKILEDYKNRIKKPRLRAPKPRGAKVYAVLNNGS